MDTDASDVAIGAELIQVQDGVERVIAYGSFALTAQQRRYCTTRKELLAVVRFTNLFRHYLLGREFTVRTDHHSLIWLMNFKQIEGQLARWMEELSRFNMVINHRPGKKHINADALSRRPIGDSCGHYQHVSDISTLPCGGCSYCRKVQTDWGDFEDSINDVGDLVPSRRPTIR